MLLEQRGSVSEAGDRTRGAVLLLLSVPPAAQDPTLAQWGGGEALWDLAPALMSPLTQPLGETHQLRPGRPCPVLAWLPQRPCPADGGWRRGGLRELGRWAVM